MTVEILKCPVCNAPLLLAEKSYKCSNNHTFDLSKEGYLNLLQNAKKTAGDAKEMMLARQHFLNAGYYDKLSNHINAILSAQIENDGAIIDIGCGEGYYLARFANERNLSTLQLYGFDISKIGVKMAAKRNKKIHWLVANFAHLPFSDHSVQIVLSMFAEYNVAEINRVLVENGAVIIVRAGKNHLNELKGIIYPEIHEKAHASEIKPFPNFNVRKFPLTYKVKISNSEDLQNLLLMTPHYWKIKPESAQKLAQYQQLEVTVSVEIDLLT